MYCEKIASPSHLVRLFGGIQFFNTIFIRNMHPMTHDIVCRVMKFKKFATLHFHFLDVGSYICTADYQPEALKIVQHFS